MMINSFSSGFKGGRQKPPASTPPGLGGSMLFNGTSTSNLLIANDADFQLGTGDFTIEWWQYQTDSNSAPRIFSIGTYSTASIAVSIEGGTFYFWNGVANSIGTVSLKNAWHHVALTRSGTSFKVFIDGTQLGTTKTISTNFNNTTQALRIGNETTATNLASYGGYLTNFNWVKGVAKYTSNFTRPTAPLSADASSKLLLLATNSSTTTTDTSGLNKSITVSNVSWDSRSPF